MRTLLSLLLLLGPGLCPFAVGQEPPQHQLSVGLIGAFRVGEDSYEVRNRPGVGVAYGLRVHRLFQLDAGLEWVPRPVGEVVSRDLTGSLDDHLFLVPIGVRFVVAPRESRWSFGLGGGGAYVNHKVGLGAGRPFFPSGVSGGGAYALANTSVALGSNSRFRLGGTARIYWFSQGRFKPGRFLTVGPELTFTF